LADLTTTVAPSRAPDLAALGLDLARPLLIVDVDEVLGLFMQGFGRFLEARGYEMRIDRYALFQNIFRPGATEHVDLAEGRVLFDDFFRFGCGDIEPAPGGVQALADLSRRAGVVILTNAPGQGRLARARWLGRQGLDYPLILNTGPKGPLAAALARQTSGPSVFIDDLLPNLDSVAESAPAVTRFQMVADPRLRLFAPSAPERHTRIDDWPELKDAVARAISRPQG
jgi:hypothetical protein